MALPDCLSRRKYTPCEEDTDSFFTDPLSTPVFPFGIDQSTQTEPEITKESSKPVAEPWPDILQIDESVMKPTTDHSTVETVACTGKRSSIQSVPIDNCLAARAMPGVLPRRMNKFVRFPVPKYQLKDITRERFVAEQKADGYLKHMRAYLEDNTYPQEEELARKIMTEQPNFYIVDDMLFHVQQLPRHGREAQDPLIQMAVPQSLIVPVLQAHHDDLYGGGHVGIFKSLQALRRHYWFPKFQETVISYVKSCDVCLQNKIPRTGERATIRHLPRVNLPLSHLCIDFVTVCPSEASAGKPVYKYLLTVLCIHSRYLWAFPCEKEDARTVCDLLVNELFLKFGLPDCITSDRGPHFVNSMVSTLYTVFGIRSILCCPYRGQSNGILERRHAFLKSVLRSYVHDQGDQWPKFLNATLFVINNSEMEMALGHCPAFLLFGVNLKSPLESRLELPESRPPALVAEHLEALLTGLERTRRIVTECMDKAEKKVERQFEKFKTKPCLQVGSIVYVYRPALDKTGHKALRFNYIGPYYICEKAGESAYYLRDFKTNRLVKTPIHLNHLQPVLLRNQRPPENEIPQQFDASIEPPKLAVDDVPDGDLIDITDSPGLAAEVPLAEVNDTHSDSDDSIVDVVGLDPSPTPDSDPGLVDSSGSREDTVQIQTNVSQEATVDTPKVRQSKRLQERQTKHPINYTAEDSSADSDTDNEPFYEITKIHKGRYHNNELQYLVSWSDGSKSWVSYDQLNSTAQQHVDRTGMLPVTGRKKR